MRFLVLLVLLVASSVHAADYTITTGPARETALQEEARRMGLTPVQTLQFYVNNLLDRKVDDIKNSRLSRLINGWETLTVEEKKSVQDLVDKLTPVPE